MMIPSSGIQDQAVQDGHLWAAAKPGLGALRVAHGVLNATAGIPIGSTTVFGLGGGSVTIPDNALVVDAKYRVRTTFTSATDAATIALSIEGADDIVAAVAISVGTTWDAAPAVQCLPDWATVGDWRETTAARNLTATVAVEALTAGVLDLFVFYVVQAG